MIFCRSLPLASFCVLLTAAAPAGAADPFFAFESTPGASVIDAKGQAWHPEFEEDGDYGESWFFVAQTSGGGTMFLMLSITNLGLSTFDGIADVQFYAPDGKAYRAHKEFGRAENSASTSRMDVQIAKNRVWAEGGAFRAKLDLDDIQVSATFKPRLPAHQFGNGRVQFYSDRSAEWAWGMLAPRAEVTGSIAAGGKSFDLAGLGYVDHGWATIKIPTYVRRWLTLRIYDPAFTIVLHDQAFKDAFGGKSLRFGVFGTAETLVSGVRNVGYTPTKWRDDDESGFKVPTEIKLDLKAGGYSVTGFVREERCLDSLDVLAQVSWPVRTVIKAFYTKPYMIRSRASYELDVTTPTGETQHITGPTLLEANYY